MAERTYILTPVGIIHSELTNRHDAPRQGYEGAPEAWIEISSDVADGLLGIRSGDEIIVITWLDRAQRDILQVHPGRNPNAPLTGVFATRSPDRPNPVGLHRVAVFEIAGISDGVTDFIRSLILSSRLVAHTAPSLLLGLDRLIVEDTSRA